MAAGKAAREGAGALVERFLAGYSERTRHAYTTDLEDFARARGQARAAAVAELLASREQGRRLALDFGDLLSSRKAMPSYFSSAARTRPAVAGGDCSGGPPRLFTGAHDRSNVEAGPIPESPHSHSLLRWPAPAPLIFNARRPLAWDRR